MFYRRKLILAILQVFGGQLKKINLQKLLFLTTNRQNKPVYEFIPYKFGSYSFSANADLTAMVKHGHLNEDETSFTKKDQKDYLKLLASGDRQIVNQIFILFKKYDTDALVKHTYINYPFYAIKSTIAENILTRYQLKKVNDSRPVNKKTVLYTIGYEGISLEAYLNKLLQNDIKVLVDVRNNPLSQKYGFSKTSLQRFCESLGIEYVHFSEVGIHSELRQGLTLQDDYNNLFNAYNKKIIPKTIDTQNKILNLLKSKKRIALTCFEADICQCHRKHLAEAIVKLPGWNYEVKHI